MKKDLFGKCPYVTAQRLLQGKWAILILQTLSEGRQRFNSIERKIGITHATLSCQLKYMEKEGLVKRTVYPEVPPRVEYELTPIGEKFAPVLSSIRSWGNQYIQFLQENRPHEEAYQALKEG